MPFIKVEAGKMNQETKEKLISGLTRPASESLGIAEEAFTILIKIRQARHLPCGAAQVQAWHGMPLPNGISEHFRHNSYQVL